MHRIKLQNAQALMRRTTGLFGWGIFPGLCIPAVLFAGLSIDRLALDGDTANNRLQQAQTAVWRDGNTTEALDLYRSLLRDWPGGPLSGEAHAGMAELLEQSGSAKAVVAQSYSSAARLSPQDPRAGSWLIRAGENWQKIGDQAAAAGSFSKCIAQYADYSDQARLALANLRLAQGEIDLALEHYQVVSDSDTDALASIARMGVSVSYERMGQLDAALAELDEDEDPWTERRHRIAERRRAIRQ